MSWCCLLSSYSFFGLALLCLYLFIKSYRFKQKLASFKDRYVLITGCDSGFGHKLAKRLDVLGFKVFAACFTQNGMEELSSTCTKNVNPIRMDVTNDDSIKRAVEEVTKLLPDKKGLWAVVNNAGVLGTTSGPTFWATRADYDNVLAVNLYGVVLVTNAFMPLIMKEKGRVVNTSSIAGRFAFGNAPYAVSKHGVEAFSDNLRRDVYKTGVTVHMLEPGFHKTPLLSVEAQKKRTEQKLKTLPEVWKKDLPSDIADIMAKRFSGFVDKVGSSNLDLVVDAYEHAVTAKYPKYRYVVGWDANYIFRPLWMAPEWFSDFILSRL
ncbi:17-beta-hydroxysteroid dehydrogenase type 6-like [Mya arenaria]|uniref:17-beta-hydroxysteroid dehydrogenase type 6-like n=1 Tax=Mya arenaria TaxID=6604 RepID=UPI0022E68773|nr:17-beta-hydroxysteroid dehydrogenase type 6-like [Mya arenaria]